MRSKGLHDLEGSVLRDTERGQGILQRPPFAERIDNWSWWAWWGRGSGWGHGDRSWRLNGLWEEEKHTGGKNCHRGSRDTQELPHATASGTRRLKISVGGVILHYFTPYGINTLAVAGLPALLARLGCHYRSRALYHKQKVICKLHRLKYATNAPPGRIPRRAEITWNPS
jgi:hypothetical protein